MGFTPPDERIKKKEVGDHLYEKYELLVRESESESCNREVLNSYINLSSKSALDTVLVSYLLSVGQYVS
jgi:hypothetical protein